MSVTPAAKVASECQQLSRRYSDRQNAPTTELSSGEMSKIVTALTSAGNLLAAADRFDPAGEPPPGFAKLTSFDEQGHLVVTFIQAEINVSPPTV